MKKLTLLLSLFSFSAFTYSQTMNISFRNDGNETIYVAYAKYANNGWFSEFKYHYSGWYKIEPGTKRYVVSIYGYTQNVSFAFSKKGGYVKYNFEKNNTQEFGIKGFFVDTENGFDYTGTPAKNYQYVRTSARAKLQYCWNCNNSVLNFTFELESDFSDKVIPFGITYNQREIMAEKLLKLSLLEKRKKLYTEGIENRQNGNLTEALTNFKEANEIEYDDKIQEAILITQSEIDTKHKNYIAQGDINFLANEFDRARYLYHKAKYLKPEDNEATDKLKKLNDKVNGIVANYSKQADNYLDQKNFDAAKKSIEQALSLQPNNIYLKDRIQFIDQYHDFWNNKDGPPANLYTLDNTKFNTISKVFEENLIEEIQFINENFDFSANVVFTKYRNGKSTIKVEELNTNSKSAEVFIKKIAEQQILPVHLMFKKEPASYYAEVRISGKAKSKEIKAKKLYKKMEVQNEITAHENSLLKKELNGHNYGKYTIAIKTGFVNNKNYESTEIVDYQFIGGPANALKSIILPGWGRKAVTYGQKKGTNARAYTLLFVGAGIGAKIYSDREYKNYENAIEQAQIDEHYEAANTLNKVFIGCIAAGGSIWLLDIISTAGKGFSNYKYKSQEKKKLAIGYTPMFNQHGIKLTYNF